MSRDQPSTEVFWHVGSSQWIHGTIVSKTVLEIQVSQVGSPQSMGDSGLVRTRLPIVEKSIRYMGITFLRIGETSP